MQARWRFALAVAVLAALMTGPFVLTAVMVWADTPAETRSALHLLADRWLPLGVLTTLAGFAVGIALLGRLFRHYVQGLLRMAEGLDVLRRANSGFRVPEEGPREVVSLAQAINRLADDRDRLLAELDARVSEARRAVEEERNRLAALMAQLAEAVIVCNAEGRIILYNEAARRLERAFGTSATAASGWIGLGRSIHALLDPDLVAYVFDALEARRGGGEAHPQLQVVTATPAGSLIRVRVSPIAGEAAGEEISGYVLMLEDVTEQIEREAARNELLFELTEGNRAAIANIRLAAEMLHLPDVDEAMRARFHAVIAREVEAVSERLEAASRAFADALRARWPLEPMRGADLVRAAAAYLQRRLEVALKLEILDEELWFDADHFSLLQALAFLAGRLVEDYGVRTLRLRLSGDERLVYLDLMWSGGSLSNEIVTGWELEPLSLGGTRSPLTLREVLERHGAAMWFDREKARHRAFVRLALPRKQSVRLPPAAAPTMPPLEEGRPEFYDFDLFAWSDKAGALEDRPLTELSYTVFDTETTGLDPTGGDEIIQIGATRIVNGRLLKHESFEQLIDPRRPLDPASIAVHHITPEMLEGHPTIAEVLPAFHRFAHDTVLVAHNAAFDMRFLQLKEEKLRIRFDQPVLDTLLLAAFLLPNQEHSLEALALYFGVRVFGRHTALGDALVTAEIFLKMIPLLAEKGVITLRQAREASQQTYYARLRY
ncbi:3'-5' exonuclease [Tepidiphilus succinatimandens]|uniref:3'-5' exonuclease n=1 Tax=Tepidiphilus succinatimandens TaxID=224436 RepID=UPI00112F4F55|nr:exonuclease domain-containing protein [Tepidiphilus succinatimandens]